MDIVMGKLNDLLLFLDTVIITIDCCGWLSGFGRRASVVNSITRAVYTDAAHLITVNLIAGTGNYQFSDCAINCNHIVYALNISISSITAKGFR